MAELDLVIAGGLVADGTGSPGVYADVGISEGRIAAIGPGLKGKRRLNAESRVVAPGFIDIHTHYDAQVFWDPALTPSSLHGVTTVVAGNCGYTIAPTNEKLRGLIARTLEQVEDMDAATLEAGVPRDFLSFPEYLASVARHGVGLNYACYFGHTSLRLAVMGEAAYERTATGEEIARMVEITAEAMAAGASGFSSSFAAHHFGMDGLPVPSRFADRTEVEAIIGAVSRTRTGVLSFAFGAPFDVTDLYAFQPRFGLPVTFGGLVTTETGMHTQLLALHRDARARGVKVWPQVTPRPLAFSIPMSNPYTLNVNPVFHALMTASLEERRAAYADRDWRRRASETLEAQTSMRPRWDTFDIMESAVHPDLVGEKILPLALARGTTPLELLLDLALDEPDLELRVRSIQANDDVEALRTILLEDQCALGLSDAGAHVGQLCDAPQATDFLGNWVRDRNLMPVEQAVRRLSGLQADLFNFTDRGYLRLGAPADVTVFDLATVSPGPVRRVRDFPADSQRLTADRPTGIDHVLVNGVPIRVDGEQVPLDVSGRPGRLVRPQARPR